MMDDTEDVISVGAADSDVSPTAAGTQEGKWVGRIGNFSVQYNLGVASIAVHIMNSYDDHVVGGDDPTSPYYNMSGEYPEPDWARYTLLGMVFLGAVVGMVVMGQLGDIVGRKKAMLLTLSLVVFGAVGSAVLALGATDSIYGVICFCRLFVGIGVGGIYPLSAARSAEHGEAHDIASKEERTETAVKVGWAFFWQIPGQVAPYVAALALIGVHNTGLGFVDVTVQWRVLYLLGAVPAAVSVYLNHRAPESKVFLESQEARGDPERTFSPWDWATAHPSWRELRRALVGMASCWFLYDVALYGTAIFTPTILKSIFGNHASLWSVAMKSMVSTAAGVPACVFAIYVLRWRGVYFLQLAGFVCLAAAFALMAAGYILAPVDPATGERGWADLLFALYCLIVMCLTAPNVSTFVLPATLFPTEVKTSFHGTAAASGKVGAVVGTFMFHPISEATSVQFVMILQAVICIIGAGLTIALIPQSDEVIGSTVAPLLDEGAPGIVGATTNADSAPAAAAAPPALSAPPRPGGRGDDVEEVY